MWKAVAYSTSFARQYGLNYIVQLTVAQKVDKNGITLQLNEEGECTALTDAVMLAVQEWIEEPQ